MQVRGIEKTPASPSNLTIILFLKSLDPVFSKKKQRSPLRNFMIFLAKKQAPIKVSAVWSSFARMSSCEQYITKFIDQIFRELLAYLKYFDEFCINVVHKIV